MPKDLIKMSFSSLKSLLSKFDQEHLLQFWDELSEEQQNFLVNDIMNLDFPQIMLFFEQASSLNNKSMHLVNEEIKPIASEAIESIFDTSLQKLDYYESLGLEEIANGKVAVILLAGGQGTRLGVSYPKGMYNINLPSNRTLFHMQALRMKRLQIMAENKFGKCENLIWYIMTSDSTHESTSKYFEDNEYFGMDKNKIILFKQNTMPCFTFDGKIILDEKCKISRAPDGNGGLYTALKKEKILNDMKQRNIRSVHVYSVDNVLVKVADPIFLGYCISRSADCGVKVVAKSVAEEAVGVVCQVNGLYRVVEYSEIPSNTANLRDDNGDLIFNAGNICNHYFTVSFLDRIVSDYENCLDLHVAKKKISFINENGLKIKPSEPNGIKIEKFIFDVFKYSQNFVVLKVLREDEFSALKNFTGTDSPSTARNDILRLHKKWLLNAGASNVEGDVEVCPLISYKGENLSNIVKNKFLKGPLCIM